VKTLFPVRKRTAESGTVAVCFRNGRIDIARIIRAGDAQPVLDLCASEEVGDSEADTLNRLRREHGLDRAHCVTLISEGDYQLQVMDAPEVPDEELKDAVRWRLNDVLDYPADTATVDVFSVPGDPGSPTRTRPVYAVAARNELIAERMESFSEAKLALKVIDIPEMAQRNLASMYETPGRALALLSLSAERGLLTFTADGELYLARGIDVGLAQLGHAEGDLRKQLLDRLVLEVQRSLDHFDRQFSFLSLSRLVLAPLPEDTGLQTYLAENLYVPVEEARLQDAIDISRVPELKSRAMQAERFMAIGAALRSEIGA
jgi:MSHA biogenesis protein MshI